MKQRRRKIRGRKLKKQRRVIILSMIGIFLFLSIGYAAFQTTINLNVKGTIKEYDRTNLYVSSSGSDVTGRGTIKRPYATIQKAYDEANSTATIYLMTNLTEQEPTSFDKQKDITLTSENNQEIRSIIRDSTNINELINITKGNLNLTNIVFDGDNIDTQSALIVSDTIEDVKIYINSGTVIKNGNNSMIISDADVYKSGGGLNIKSNASLILNAGEISNNYAKWGGGILHSGAGTIIMNGGKIENNRADYGAGVNSSNIIINNGEISNNTADNNGGALVGGNIQMTGGVISNNTANNIGVVTLVSGYSFEMNGGIIRNNNGTRILFNMATNATFTYKFGIICENTPTSTYETHTTCPS